MVNGLVFWESSPSGPHHPSSVRKLPIMAIPNRSEIVIIGGGVVGVSIAYQLARRGKTDVTLLERKALTEGSTWHAAGLVGQLRSSANLTQLMRKSVADLRNARSRDGVRHQLAWRRRVRVASSPERWEELQRVFTQGKSFGFDVHLVSPQRGQGDLPSAEHRRRLRRRPGPPATVTSTRIN